MKRLLLLFAVICCLLPLFALPSNASTWTFPKPVDLHTISDTTNSFTVEWDTIKGPSGQNPSGYEVRVWQLNGVMVRLFDVAVYRTAFVGNLHPGWTYKVDVWANGAPAIAPYSRIEVTLKNVPASIPPSDPPLPSPPPFVGTQIYFYLTSAQQANAAEIINAAMAYGVGRYGALIAVATAIQESSLRDYTTYTAGQGTSLGDFQQIASWGTVAQRTNVTDATDLFLRVLVTVPNWRTIPLWQAAYDVQHCAYAYRMLYGHWQGEAQNIVNGYLGTS